MVEASMFTDYISIPVVFVCIMIGYVVKNYTKIPNKNIPLIAGIIGILVNCYLVYSAKEASVTSITVISGAISGFASTGVYETIMTTFGIRDRRHPIDIKPDNEHINED